MVIDDVRHAGRRLRSRPGATAAAAAMLALGIGLSTAMSTIADALLLRPVPFRDPERLAQLHMGNERGGRLAVAPDVFRAWRSSRVFEAVESAIPGTALIDTGGGPVARAQATVTPGVFHMLHVQPVRGRLFHPDEGRAGADDRVLISEDVWRASFAADPALVGRPIVVDARPLVVVGILPSRFRFPSSDTVVWRPIDFEAPPPGPAGAQPVAYVRFAAGIPETDALRLATDVARAVDASTSELWAMRRPLAGVVLDSYHRRAVSLLVGGVGLVFLVLCANVSSLLLVRLTSRRQEVGVCSALGASRGRLLGQALVEHAMLGGVGLAAGVGMGWLLVAMARAFLPEAFLLRTLNPLSLDVRALAVASAAGVLATAASGVLPAWLGTRVDPAEALRPGGHGGTETRAARSLTRALVAGEIALACMLLVGAALLARSFANLAAVDRGLDSRGVMVARIALPTDTFTDRAARLATNAAVEAGMRRLPGIRQVALSFGLPPRGGAIHFSDRWESDMPGASPVSMDADSYWVGPDFFELYRIPIVRGRTFESRDPDGAVIVGERLAARLWPGTDPVGRSFRFLREEFHVIGVAREINHPSMDPRIDRPEFYRPFQESRRSSSFYMMSLRCAATCPDGAVVRRQLMSISPAIVVLDVGPLDDVYSEQLAGPRAAAALGMVFATVAVLAAAGGLFGVLSGAVARRRREFGIRTALGASHQQIRRLVLREGALVGGGGIALGSIGGWALGRALSALQYGVSPADPLSWSIVAGVLALTTLGAAWLPARQAARVDPVALLHEQ